MIVSVTNKIAATLPMVVEYANGKKETYWIRPRSRRQHIDIKDGKVVDSPIYLQIHDNPRRVSK